MLAVPRNLADDIAAECFELGSCGVHAEESGEAARLNVYFEAPAGAEPADALADVSANLVQGLRAGGLWPAGAQVLSGDIEAERDWSQIWRAFYQPVWATDNIVVHPPWIPVATKPGQIAIAIEPAMAFGTGGHESTQLALQAIEQRDVAGRTCLDVGTGSSVLSIAMMHLGAASVTAVDTDPVVIDNARCNLDANLTVDAVARTELISGSVQAVAGQTFDVIVANIESHLVRPILPDIAQALRPGGWGLFSGLVETERERFISWLAEHGLIVDATWSKNNWFSCRAQR